VEFHGLAVIKITQRVCPSDCHSQRLRRSEWGVYTIQQTSSKLPANYVFKTHALMLDVCWIV